VPVGVLEDGLDAVEVARDHPVRPVRDRDRLLRAANTAPVSLATHAPGFWATGAGPGARRQPADSGGL
jgi:hypothetical protein